MKASNSQKNADACYDISNRLYDIMNPYGIWVEADWTFVMPYLNRRSANDAATPKGTVFVIDIFLPYPIYDGYHPMHPRLAFSLPGNLGDVQMDVHVSWSSYEIASRSLNTLFHGSDGWCFLLCALYLSGGVIFRAKSCDVLRHYFTEDKLCHSLQAVCTVDPFESSDVLFDLVQRGADEKFWPDSSIDILFDYFIRKGNVEAIAWLINEYGGASSGVNGPGL